MYLCKVAMDIVAKHIPADKDGVRIAELDEQSYRDKLWDHRPLTDFWRVGRGIAQRLYSYGIDTMGKIARCSIHQEELLYKLFGVNANYLSTMLGVGSLVRWRWLRLIDRNIVR